MTDKHTSELAAEITQLPVQPGAAMRLLWMLEDPRTSAADLGRVIESDPALSTQVIRLANTAFYGLSGQVSSAWRAVTVLGLATVRALATTAAFDLFNTKGRAVPDDFWAHSVCTAAASSCAAARLGHQANEAFSVGLLHDIGSALMFRRAPRRYELVLERLRSEPDVSILALEIAEFGISHAQVAEAALAAMKFPAALTTAIASHHFQPHKVESPLGKVLILGDAIAAEIEPTTETTGSIEEALLELGLQASAGESLIEQVKCDQENLVGFLNVRT